MIIGPIYRASQAMRWLAGSVHTATWEETALIAAITAPLLLVAGLLARALDLLDLDDASACGIGLPPIFARTASVLLAAPLTAPAIAILAGMGFVGPIPPPLAQFLPG